MSNDHIFEVEFKEITTDNELFCQFDEHHGVLFLDVKNSFTAEDFQTIENLINSYFEKNGELAGVIVNAPKFPYWSSSENRRDYLNFAAENHQKFKKVAFLMGGFFIKIVARVARGRVYPEIKLFKYNQIEEAQSWILGQGRIHG